MKHLGLILLALVALNSPPSWATNDPSCYRLLSAPSFSIWDSNKTEWTPGPESVALAKAELIKMLNVAHQAGFDKKKIKYLNDESIHEMIDVKGIRKLEVGPSDEPICDDCTYVDIHPTVVELLRERIKNLGGDPSQVVLANAKNLPFQKEEFDLIISKNFSWNATTQFFHQLKIDVLKEYFRTLKSGGKVLLLNKAYRWPGIKPSDAKSWPYVGTYDAEAFVYVDAPHKVVPETKGYFDVTDPSYFMFEGATVRNLSQVEAFMVTHAQKAQVAKAVGFKVTWLSTFSYEGLILEKP